MTIVLRPRYSWGILQGGSRPWAAESSWHSVWGFNKTKIVEAAQKYVQKGKIPAAIQEYQKVLAKEPRNLDILTIVAGLHESAGNKEEALKCLYKLGQVNLQAGFARNAIAF